MSMNEEEFKLWDDITFKTTSYTKNFDFILPNEQFITEYDGEISKLRIDENKPPELIGEFGISTWNIGLANSLDVDLLPLIKTYAVDIDSYKEVHDLITSKQINLNTTNKLVIIQHLIVRDDYRKHKITEEFVEFLYRTYYDPNTTKIVSMVKPIQYDEMNYDFYFNKKSLKNTKTNKIMKASTYYGLDKFLKKDDRELNEYKLFSMASKCGFSRVGYSYIFEFKPNKIVKRLKEKQTILKELEL